MTIPFPISNVFLLQRLWRGVHVHWDWNGSGCSFRVPWTVMKALEQKSHDAMTRRETNSHQLFLIKLLEH